MADFDHIKTAPTDVLCDAARRLQEAHDFVETHEFSMQYGSHKGATCCCFIGSVRQVAGEHEERPNGPLQSRASELALLALDNAARARGYKGPAHRFAPGGVAEATIVRNEHGEDLAIPKWMKKPEALKTYRVALREMQRELMSREDLPVTA